MLENFGDYVETRLCENYAHVLLAADVDVYTFCEVAIGLAEQRKLTETSIWEEGLFDRLGLGGVSRAASMAQGAGNVVSGLGTAAGDALGNKWGSFKNKVSNAWSGAKAGLQAAGNNIGQRYKQGVNAQEIAQATNAIKALQQKLSAMGYPKDFLGQTLEPLYNQLTQDGQGNKNLGHQMGGNLPPQAQPQAQQAPAGPHIAPPPGWQAAG